MSRSSFFILIINHKTHVSLADARVILLLTKGEGNEKIIYVNDGCVDDGYYRLQ